MARVNQRRTVSRSNTPQSPPRQHVPAQPSSPQTRRSARSQSRTINDERSVKSKIPEKTLAVVEEEGDLIEVVLQGQAPRSPSVHENDDEEIEDADDEDVFASMSDASSDDDMEAQLAELDKDLIIDNLSALLDDATNILSLFQSDASESSLEDLRSAKTVSGRRYRNFKARFDASSDPYRKDGFLLMDRIILKLSRTAPVESDQWRPDAILYMANLAIAVSDLVNGSEAQIRNCLEFIFNNFPGRYLMGNLNGTSESFDVATTKLVDATIDMSLLLRTHFFILSIQDHVNSEAFDPDEMLSQLFFEEEGRSRGFEDVTDVSLLEQISRACAQKVREIRAFLHKKSNKPIDLKKLRQQYPWPELLLSFIKWSGQRKLELGAQISAQGGVEAIVRVLGDDHQEPVEVAGAPQIQDATEAATHQSIDEIPDRSRQSLPRFSSTKAQKLNELKARQAAEADRPDSSDDSSSDSMEGEEEEGEVEVDEEDEEEIEEGSIPAAQTHDEQGPELQIDETPRRHQASVSDGDMVPNVEDELLQETEAVPASGQPSPPPPTQGSIVPTQETLEVLAVYERQKRQSNKENINTMRRFDQRQPGAKRVGWDDPEGSDKRDHDAFEEDDDDPEDFETVLRKPKRQRTDKAVSEGEESPPETDVDATLPSPNKLLKGKAPIVRTNRPPPSTQPEPSRSAVRRQNGTDDDDDDDDRDRPQQKQPRPPPSSAPPRHLTTQRQPSNASPLPPASQAERAKQQAKVVVRRLVQPAQRRNQTRVPWSSAEVNRLLDLIEIYGTSWSLLMDQDREHPNGPELQGRGQVGIRDKARNIKMDFLKACRRLPTGFGAVALKAAEYQKLDDLGIPYVRHENGIGPTATGAVDVDE